MCLSPFKLRSSTNSSLLRVLRTCPQRPDSFELTDFAFNVPAPAGHLSEILPADGGDCEDVLAAGVDIGTLPALLHDEGAKSFVKDWHELMTVIDSKSADLGTASKTP